MNSHAAFTPRILVTIATVIFPVLSTAQTTHIAYDNPIGIPGNQTFGGSVGMDFNIGVNPIRILELGAFDSGQDGFLSPRTVSIWDRDTTSLVTSLTLDVGLSGTL